MYTFCSDVGICKNNVFFRNSWSLRKFTFCLSFPSVPLWLTVMSSVMLFMCVCLRPHVLSASSDCHRRSSYKDCNTLHLPMERFSPVRRFSDGAATIQAFKAHLENSSLIKKLKQVCHYFLWKNMLKALVKRWRLLTLQRLCFFFFFFAYKHILRLVADVVWNHFINLKTIFATSKSFLVTHSRNDILARLFQTNEQASSVRPWWQVAAKGK